MGGHHGCHRSTGGHALVQKKDPAACSAERAAIGRRSVKSGQSQWFIGYKKHSLRLWLPEHSDSVLLVPLMTWAAPGNRDDVLFLEPSLRYCHRHLEFTPDLVVTDMAYTDLAMQRRLREQLHVGMVTRLRPNLNLSRHIEPALMLRCRQGQPLRWLGLHEKEQLHWFAVDDQQPLCPFCWEQSQCPRQFSFTPADHEIVLGTIPLNTAVAQKLLRQVRSWIEAAQSYEKNQLGLGRMFLNSLHLTWTVALLADTVSLLRAHALLRRAPAKPLLTELMPTQTALDLDDHW